MNKLLLFLLTSIAVSAQNTAPIKDGMYRAIGTLHDDIYAIELTDNSTKIKFYTKDSENNEQNDFKTFTTGEIVKIKEKYLIENIETDETPYDAQAKVEMKVKGDIIQFNTLKLMSRLFSNFARYSDNLKFQLETQSH